PHKVPTSILDHCGKCRKTFGSLFQAWMVAPKPWITITFNYKEESEGKLVEFQSSAHGTRSFCGACGTNLFYDSSKKKAMVEEMDGAIYLVNVTIGSLDEESLTHVELVKPKLHVWWDHGIGWVKEAFT
ncbi:hypothetical protein M422DRAFT_108579, partial [Sphaerobolus stellatus SS14]